jgi:5-formyltetrahydrofolate cyclo-ligase
MIKKELRERIWRLLEEKRVARFPMPIEGRIPNFQGSTAAAFKLFALDVYRKAKVIKINPDAPQHPVREMAIKDGKIVYMPTPRLRKGFIELKPQYIPKGEERKATSIKHAPRYGRYVPLDEIKPIDLIVTGAVSATCEGGKLGKGGGYSDLEYAILRELGKITEKTPVVTTLHPLQIVDHLPMKANDVPLDYIITYQGIIKTNTAYPKPKGILWEMLSEEDLDRMPILREVKMKTKHV